MLFVLSAAAPAHAYIGPGAGFAALGSFLVVFVAMLSAVVTLVTWPLRYVVRAVRYRRAHARSRVKRFVILGLDGMEPTLVERFMDEGRLPNLSKLRDRGCYRRLGTTLPPLSPVAWSSFLTGSNPGKHNIFDFLTRDKRTYAPLLSSVQIRGPRRTLRLGAYEIPLGRPDLRLLRRSIPFWKVLGDHGIFSSIIRVPITWPPEKFHGVLLSAMCVPDLRGSQGTFSFYTTSRADGAGPNGVENVEHTGGEQFQVTRDNGTISTYLVGPESPLHRDRRTLRCPFTIRLDGADGRAELRTCGRKVMLEAGVYSDWVKVEFKAGLGMKIRGICQFLLIGTSPEFQLYVTPIHIDPEKPAMPISHPAVYATYIAKRQGPFATLGLAEDTWGLNAGVLDDETYLDQCRQADDERERMFFDALDKTRRGCVVCVFDGTDRIQHMFWRYIDERHPAHAGQTELERQRRDAIEQLYARMDDLVGRTLARCRDGDLLMVISDHGFKPFRRGIDLNAWLEREGYLKLQPDGRGRKYLAGVDWSATKAYAIGLAGIYLNIRDREARGIVDPGEEADRLREELAGRLGSLRDPQNGETAISRAYIASKCYRGPYKDEAPDLIVGYTEGYRVSWEAAVGQVTDAVFHDNTKAWSGDHCIDPRLVRGVLFCNHPVETEHPRLIDIGPTVLDMFGVAVPAHMDGRPLRISATGRHGDPRSETTEAAM